MHKNKEKNIPGAQDTDASQDPLPPASAATVVVVINRLNMYLKIWLVKNVMKRKKKTPEAQESLTALGPLFVCWW